MTKKDRVLKVAREKGWLKGKGPESAQLLFLRDEDDSDNETINDRQFAFLMEEPGPSRSLDNDGNAMKKLKVLMASLMKDLQDESENEAALFQDSRSKN